MACKAGSGGEVIFSGARRQERENDGKWATDFGSAGAFISLERRMWLGGQTDRHARLAARRARTVARALMTSPKSSGKSRVLMPVA